MATYDDILGAAQALPPIERVRLVQALWDTVPSEDWPKPSQAWIAEAQRRSVEFDSGRTTDSFWPEVRKRARGKAGLDG